MLYPYCLLSYHLKGINLFAFHSISLNSCLTCYPLDLVVYAQRYKICNPPPLSFKLQQWKATLILSAGLQLKNVRKAGTRTQDVLRTVWLGNTEMAVAVLTAMRCRRKWMSSRLESLEKDVFIVESSCSVSARVCRAGGGEHLGTADGHEMYNRESVGG